MKIIVAGLLSAAILTAAGCGVFRRPRNWAQMKSAAVDLDGLGEVRLPEGMKPERDPSHTGDEARFDFRRIHDTHINGMTSYAESLSLTLFAPDYPKDRFDARLGAYYRQPPFQTEDEGSSRWEFYRTTYEQHPVREPSWFIRMGDHAAGHIIEWRGFEKQYPLDVARANLRHLRSTLKLTADRKQYFANHRDWDTDAWPSARDANLVDLNAALGAIGFPPVRTGAWTRHREWRYTIDDERPQRFQFARFIRGLKMPEGPFRLLGPITAFRWVQNRWWQNRQVPGAYQLPDAIVPGLAHDLIDRDLVYFYRIHSLNIWKEQAVAGKLREFITDGDAMARTFDEGKLIGGDGEP